jgi:hypothetical protein
LANGVADSYRSVAPQRHCDFCDAAVLRRLIVDGDFVFGKRHYAVNQVVIVDDIVCNKLFSVREIVISGNVS